MLYYVYYDAYGYARKAVSQTQLAAEYENSTDMFFTQMCKLGNNETHERATGHVGTLRFLDEEELQEFLDSLGDEVSGFYEGAEGSRPYNF